MPRSKYPIYFALDGVTRISKSEWFVLRRDRNTTVVAQFQNDTVKATLHWLGRVPQVMFEESYPLYEVVIEDFVNGHWVYSAESGHTYATREAAVNAYEGYLACWTECSVDEHGKFNEVGNLLGPEPEPDPNIPVSATTADEGAW